MISPEETQPRSPFKAPTAPPQEPELLTERSGPGCLLYVLVGLVVFGLALVIIALSGLAGWASGQRIAQGNAAATRSAAIDEQLSRIPGDIASGNQTLLNARLQYLATLTPAVPGLESYIATATAVYFANLPSPTPMPSPTVPALPTADATSTPTPEGTAGLDLAAILRQARAAIELRDWKEAIELLDVILAADPTYQTATVRSLMSQALVQRALLLFRTGDVSDLAEAITLTDRAQQFGDISDINYESYIAGLYLEALNTIGTSYPAAIRALVTVYTQAPGYRDVAQLLFQQYVGYGDAWVAQSEYCPAVGQYQAALGLFQDAGVSAKLTNAETICAQATPVGTPPEAALTPGAPFEPIAPVGVPETPGG